MTTTTTATRALVMPTRCAAMTIVLVLCALCSPFLLMVTAQSTIVIEMNRTDLTQDAFKTKLASALDMSPTRLNVLSFAIHRVSDEPLVPSTPVTTAAPNATTNTTMAPSNNSTTGNTTTNSSTSPGSNTTNSTDSPSFNTTAPTENATTTNTTNTTLAPTLSPSNNTTTPSPSNTTTNSTHSPNSTTVSPMTMAPQDSFNITNVTFEFLTSLTDPRTPMALTVELSTLWTEKDPTNIRWVDYLEPLNILSLTVLIAGVPTDEPANTTRTPFVFTAPPPMLTAGPTGPTPRPTYNVSEVSGLPTNESDIPIYAIILGIFGIILIAAAITFCVKKFVMRKTDDHKKPGGGYKYAANHT